MSTIKNLAADTTKLAEVPTIEPEVLATIEGWEPESSTVSLCTGKGKYGQETEQQRFDKLRKLVGIGSVRYAGMLGVKTADAMIKDENYGIGPNKSLKLADLACGACDDWHGSPANNHGHWVVGHTKKQGRGLASQPLFIVTYPDKTTRVIAVSKTCVCKYLCDDKVTSNATFPARHVIKAFFTPVPTKGK